MLTLFSCISNLTNDVKNSGVDKVASKVRPLAVIFHKILEKGNNMKSFSQLRRFLSNVSGHSSQMVVVREAVKMNEEFDVVTLLQEGGGEVFMTHVLVGEGEMQPLGLQRMEFCVEERFGDSNLKNKKTTKQRLLKIYHLGFGFG